MPTDTPYVCLRCGKEFIIPIYTVEEQRGERLKDRSLNFGKPHCPEDSCGSADVMKKSDL